jgi:hypothetical protein
MTYGSAIMFAVAAMLGLVGIALLLRLRSPTIGERRTYAFRMIGIMLTSGAIVLAISAAAMWQWSTEI